MTLRPFFFAAYATDVLRNKRSPVRESFIKEDLSGFGESGGLEFFEFLVDSGTVGSFKSERTITNA